MSNETNLDANNLVFDAVPDPPRILNDEDDGQIASQIGVAGVEKPERPPNNQKSSTANNSNSKSSTSKTKNFKCPRSQKKAKTTINYNIINSCNVKIGPTVKHVVKLNNYQNHDNASDKNSFKEETREMTHEVQSLSDCQLEINEDDMYLIKIHIGKRWKDVAKSIGYSKGQIEQFLENHKGREIGEVFYRILIDWKQAYAGDATIGRLLCALWSSQEYECAEQLAATHCV